MERSDLRKIADYQFGNDAGIALLPDASKVTYRKTGKPDFVLLDGERLATFRPHVGLFSLSIKGAEKIHSALPQPKCRIYMNREASPFVAEGKTAFAKHVVKADKDIRARDEVLIVDGEDKLLGTGKTILSSIEMKSFKKGPAVDVREGVR